MIASHPTATNDVAGFHALRSVGLATGTPLRASAVVVLPPVVDTTGIAAPGRGGRPARVTTVVATRKRLLDELTDQAQRDGAVGLVGVEFSETGFSVQPSGAPGTAVEVTVSGLPVTSTTDVASTAWFRTALAATDVATLVYAGWVPVDVLVAGTVLTRTKQHREADGFVVTSRRNNELPGATDLIQRARRQLREGFYRAARGLGADGVLLHGDFVTSWSSTLHLVEVSATANAIGQWSDNAPRATRSLWLSP